MKRIWVWMLLMVVAVGVEGAVFGAEASGTDGVRNVRIGVQNQPIGDVIIKEPAKAVWDATADGIEYMEIILPEGFKWEALPQVTVTSGDVTVLTSGVKDIDGRTLRIPLKTQSGTASELTLTGGTVTLDRSVPEGMFTAKIGGTALIDNYSPTATGGGFDTSTLGEIALFRVITPADSDGRPSEKTVMTVGEKGLRIGDRVMETDAAPFIDEKGRTMVPLRAMATAMHLTEDQIVWNQREQTVTVFKGSHVISVRVGESHLVRDGVTIPMDSAAVICKGRLMMPIRAVGHALGAKVEWDEATRTITIE